MGLWYVALMGVRDIEHPTGKPSQTLTHELSRNSRVARLFLTLHSCSTFLRLLCGEALPSAGRISIEAPSAPKTREVSTPVAEGKATPDQGPLIPGADTSAQSGDQTSDDQPRAGAAPPCGVTYLGRYWTETVTIPPSQNVARVLADAFCALNRPEKQPRQEPPLSKEVDGVDSLTENLLCVAGLEDVRDSRCGDLYRSQLLVLVLCVGVARAVVTGQTAGSRGGGGALAATDQRERHHAQPTCDACYDRGSTFIFCLLRQILVTDWACQLRNYPMRHALSFCQSRLYRPCAQSPLLPYSRFLLYVPPLMFAICSVWMPFVMDIRPYAPTKVVRPVLCLLDEFLDMEFPCFGACALL